MGPVGIEPTPLVLQTSVRTSYTKDPILIMLEYPSRSNLNCLIVVLRGLGRKGDEFLNLSWIVDIREIEKTIIIVGSSGLEPLPWGPDLQSGCRIRTTFATQFLYPEMELNHHHLYVRQIRFHYAIGAKCMFLNFPLINIQTKCIRTEKWYRAILEIDMSHLRSPDPSAFWWT